MAYYVNKVINIALAEVGYLEKKSNSQLDNKTANAGGNNYTKYGRDMHAIYPEVMDFPAYWCDSFVDWCFYKAYGIANAKKLLGGDFDDYTVNSAQLYKSAGAWYTSNPKIGDQIFFNNGVRICHTGLVYKVDSSRVYTIEGNTSGGSTVVANGGGVANKSYPLTYYKISGYGRPNYGAKSSNTSATAPVSSVKKNTIIEAGQIHANNFAGCGLVTDGVRGTKTIKAAIKIVQHALNLDYHAGISEDGVWGTKTNSAFGNHYVKVGETQYLVTALEIICMLKGIDPKGVENPGKFGNGLASACGTTKAYKATFKKFTI